MRQPKRSIYAVTCAGLAQSLVKLAAQERLPHVENDLLALNAFFLSCDL